MLTTGISSAVSLTCFTFGTSISSPNSITCAVSMKMINSTRTTSTSGTTFISERVLCDPRNRLRPLFPPPSEKAIFLILELLFRQVQKLEREVLHTGAEFLNAVSEVVVEDGRGNGRDQSHGGCDQRVCDS